MVYYRRYLSESPDGVYFFTLVTKDRKLYLRNEDTIRIVHEILMDTFHYCNGKVLAYVYNPDHIHLLVKQGNRPFSDTIKRFKLQVNQKLGLASGTIWQKRFWEHKIRDHLDFNRHADYIHFNPVKHGHVKSPIDSPNSSFRDYVKRGFYRADWSSDGDVEIKGMEFD